MSQRAFPYKPIGSSLFYLSGVKVLGASVCEAIWYNKKDNGNESNKYTNKV